MEPELLTTKQAASVMNIGEERARQSCCPVASSL